MFTVKIKLQTALMCLHFFLLKYNMWKIKRIILLLLNFNVIFRFNFKVIWSAGGFHRFKTSLIQESVRFDTWVARLGRKQVTNNDSSINNFT